MSVSDTVIAKLAAYRTQIKRQQTRINRLKYSRDIWKKRHAACRYENKHLSRKVRRLEERLNPPKREPQPSLRLSADDVSRILKMPPR